MSKGADTNRVVGLEEFNQIESQVQQSRGINRVALPVITAAPKKSIVTPELLEQRVARDVLRVIQGRPLDAEVEARVIPLREKVRALNIALGTLTEGVDSCALNY